ncbi:hypothetical protein BDV95DRAFT_560525 [Massariosphaeria phaeospora]|uniref:Uncharacterized protein n=1 Tax=Massariosphaeria phaeospora TaxID=100035 RepID=A0A7C8ICU3_9PLEO|nr:hypothetical protein BDV95DRAFT_560525 [Massariosphaeria phaeospora]
MRVRTSLPNNGSSPLVGLRCGDTRCVAARAVGGFCWREGDRDPDERGLCVRYSDDCEAARLRLLWVGRYGG